MEPPGKSTLLPLGGKGEISFPGTPVPPGQGLGIVGGKKERTQESSAARLPANNPGNVHQKSILEENGSGKMTSLEEREILPPGPLNFPPLPRRGRRGRGNLPSPQEGAPETGEELGKFSQEGKKPGILVEGKEGRKE